jgi:hypothetical protein
VPPAPAIRRRALGAAALGAALAAPAAVRAQPRLPAAARLAALARGLNVAHWFRFPPNWGDAEVVGYLRDSDLAAIRAAGFTALRLPIDPGMVCLPDGRWHAHRLRQVETVVGRIQAAGLAAVVEPHPPTSSTLDADMAARARIVAFWRELAPAMARLDPDRVFLELMSEPIFRGIESQWHAMQRDLLAEVRARAPRHTIIVTGTGWSSIDGLLALPPIDAPNLVYTFHFYWPMQFTHQGTTYASPRFGGLRGLPWPATPADACTAALPPQADDGATRLADWYCRQGYDAARQVAEIGRARAWADRHGVALWAGEFGTGCNPPDRATKARFMRDVRLAMEANRVPWCMWALDNCQGIGASSRARDFTLPADFRAALGLAAPR